MTTEDSDHVRYTDRLNNQCLAQCNQLETNNKQMCDNFKLQSQTHTQGQYQITSINLSKYKLVM